MKKYSLDRKFLQSDEEARAADGNVEQDPTDDAAHTDHPTTDNKNKTTEPAHPSSHTGEPKSDSQ